MIIQATTQMANVVPVAVNRAVIAVIQAVAQALVIIIAAT